MEFNIDIACVGSAVLDLGHLDRSVGLLKTGQWNSVISGSAFVTAAAAALANRSNIRIAALTTLGADVHDDIHDHIRNAISNGCGIQIFSQPQAKMPISVYPPPGFDKFSKIQQERDPDFMFNPLAIAGIEELRPTVAIFSGGPTTFAGTRDNLIALAERWKSEGTIVITDMNPRGPVDVVTAERWGRASHIMKLGNLEMQENLYASMGPQEDHVIRQFLDLGDELVCYTRGEHGSRFYRKDREPFGIFLQDLLIGLPMPIGGGEAFKGGLALSLVDKNITAENLGQALKDDGITRDLGECANEVAGLYLQARNGMPVPGWAVERAEAICAPVILAPTPEEIVRISYPNSTKDFSFEATHG